MSETEEEEMERPVRERSDLVSFQKEPPKHVLYVQKWMVKSTGLCAHTCSLTRNIVCDAGE